MSAAVRFCPVSAGACRAVRIALKVKHVEAHLQSIINKQPSGKRGLSCKNQFDGFGCLNQTDDAGGEMNQGA